MNSISTRMSRIVIAVALTLVAIGAGLALAGENSSASADESTPKGQLTRRGLSGTVVEVDKEGGNEATSIVVETQFGNVTVGISSATITFRGPAPDGVEEPREIRLRDRVGILLDRSPVAASSTPIDIGGGDEGDPAASSTPIDILDGDDTTATSTTPNFPSGDGPEPVAESFRDVEALQITVVPSKATRSHLRGVIKSKGNGKFTILRGDGTEEEFDSPPGLSGAAGDDLLFIVKSGPGGGPKSITNSVSEDEIIDRLDALTLAAEDNPELADGLAKLRGKVNEKRLERLEALIESSDPDDQDLINGAITKARGKSENRGSGSSDGDDGDSSGPGNSGSGGGNSGSSDSGGGNSGNQGGGPNQ